MEPLSYTSQVNVQGEITIKTGEKLVAETDTKQLYLNTDTLDVTVIDKSTGNKWTTKVENATAAKDKSIMNIMYINSDGTLKEWNAYENIIETSQFSINAIDNGVRLSLFFESSTKSVNQMMPEIITQDDMDMRFYTPIDAALAEGKIDDSTASLFKSVLALSYKYDNVVGGYKLSAGTSPNAMKQLYLLVDLVDYDIDKLREDNDKFGKSTTIPDVPSFMILLDIALDGDDLVVNIPTYECITGDDLFELQLIDVMSTFGHVSANDASHGYMFVPDGAGALIEINSYNSRLPQYAREVYDNDYYNQMYNMSSYKETLSMPVFGVYSGQSETPTQGLMGIIESGAELAEITAMVGTTDAASGGVPENKIYSSVNVTQFSRVKLYGPYSTNDTRYLVTTGPIELDYTIRYKFFGEGATYYDMAETYREYLVEQNNIELSHSTEAKIYLEILSALTVPKHIFGVPFDDIVSMTTYEQAVDIIDELGDMSLVINYDGAFNGGANTELMLEPDLVSQNGSASELEKLIQSAESKGHEFFIGTNLTTIKNTAYPFSASVHGLNYYDSEPALIYDYDLRTGVFTEDCTPRYILNPIYFESVVQNFIDGTSGYNNVAIKDVGYTYYASYNEDDILTTIEANRMINEGLQNLQDNKVVLLENPNMSRAIYADYATDISRESSNLSTFYTNVPFRQLVLNGIAEYTTLDVNMSGDDLEYFLLQAVETGSYPKFTVSAEKEDILTDSDFRYYLNVEFDTVKSDIFAISELYTSAFAEIGTTEITNHRVLQKNVYETTYATGVKVITNYNTNNVFVQGVLVGANDFKIVE